jgi:hypothetical protein
MDGYVGIVSDARVLKRRGRRAVIAVAAGFLAFVSMGGPVNAGTHFFDDRTVSCTAGIWDHQNYYFTPSGGDLGIKYVDSYDWLFATSFRWLDSYTGNYSATQSLTYLQTKYWYGLDDAHTYRIFYSKTSGNYNCNGWLPGNGNYHIDFNAYY